MDRATLLESLWPAAAPSRVGTWAILDCARDPRIYPAVDMLYGEKCCLFAGELSKELQAVAPYLVRLHREDRFAEYVLRNGWGKAWGSFVRADATLETLRRHFRTFLRVRSPEGRYLLFRYYDPRVLRIYLPTCNSNELKTVFGPVESFIVEQDQGAKATEYKFDGSRLLTT